MSAAVPEGEPAAMYRHGLHTLAIVTAVAIFPLVLVGAGVTSKDAGMAFSDWPTSNGYFVNPPHWWQIDATRWEHGHRLIGWTVGMLAIALVATSWRSGGRTRLLAILVLLAIIVQGVMGGLRVNLISTKLAMLHGIWGQICFTLTCCMALVTSRTWVSGRAALKVPAGHALQKLCFAGAVATFIQLVLGAVLRHFASDSALIFHLLWAVVVALIAGWIVVWVIGVCRGRNLLETLGWILGGLMITQLLLGGLTWIATLAGGFGSPLAQWALPSAHVAVGALLLACTTLMMLSAFHLVQPVPVRDHRPDVAAVPSP